MYNWGGNSGAGAVEGRDGFNQMGPMITLGGLVIPNMETYEQLYPITVRRHELRTDGGGPGRFRGGTGVAFEVDVACPAEYSFRGEGTTRPTGLGVEGGRAGAIGEVRRRRSGGASWTSRALLPEAAGTGAHLTIRSPGGGGVGDPFERPVGHGAAGRRGRIGQPEAAETEYGVVIGASGCSVDRAQPDGCRDGAASKRREEWQMTEREGTRRAFCGPQP